MTNDKNKTNNLVASTDDDPTAELEILGRARARMMTDDELEADANTYDCEDEYSGAGTPADRISHLKREIRLRDESIDRLQFDLEQLRSRWSGLDKEIKVRERLTDNVNSELRQVRNSLATTQRKYRDSQEDIKRLSSQIAQYDQTNIESSQIAESLRDMLAQRESHIAELEKQILRNNDDLASLSARIANSVSEDSFSQIEQKEKQSREQLSLLRQRLDATEAQLTEKDAQLEDARKSLHETTIQNRELAKQLASKESLMAQSSTDLASTRRQLDETQGLLVQVQKKSTIAQGANDGSHGLGHNDSELTSEQSGLLLHSRQQVRDLLAQIGRTEAYADSLRLKLQDQVREAEDAHRAKEQFELALIEARSKIAELGKQLETERQLSANYLALLDERTREFEDEIRKIRFELGTAQQTIAENETVNEQLTSDLFDNQSFRQALESQLERTEESSENQIRDLRKKIRRLEYEKEEDRHKIANKDGAIAALLNELASRSTAIDMVGEAAPDDYVDADPPTEGPLEDKSPADRVTRLLIGNVDGQELRFPLFKDRLTIGRTTHNDIQLKAQYISRRHALVVTEKDRTRIVDWGSKNGIAVNKKKVSEQTLKNGDIVTIGTADFRYEERAKR